VAGVVVSNHAHELSRELVWVLAVHEMPARHLDDFV
jgi:hypothetical protein